MSVKESVHIYDFCLKQSPPFFLYLVKRNIFLEGLDLHNQIKLYRDFVEGKNGLCF